MSSRPKFLVGLVGLGITVAGLSFATPAQANVTTGINVFPYEQNWSNTGLIATTDDWSGVVGVQGYRGDGLSTSAGTDPQTVTADGSGTPTNVTANNVSTSLAAVSTGGLIESHHFETVAMQGSGTADAPHLVFRLDLTSKTDANFAFDAKDVDDQATEATQPIAVQYRVGGAGAYTNLPAGFIADASSGPSLATLVTSRSVPLPAATDGAAEVYVRVITSDALGSDEFIGIDNVNITAEDGGGPGPLEAVSPGDKVAEVDLAITPFTMTATGGTEPYTWGATGLPDGVSINPTTGEVTGTPTTTCTCSVTATVTDDEAATDDVVFNFTVNAAPEVTPIHEVQGTGARSPFAPASGNTAGDVKTVQGVVTAIYRTGGFNGMFIQTGGTGGATDATPGASDALFIFGGSNMVNVPADVVLGDSVRVTGPVSEFFDSTQITPASPAGVVELGVALDPVVPLEIAYPTTSADREAQEGMLLAPTDTFTVTNTFQTNGFAEIGLATGDIPLKQPTEFVARTDTAGLEAIVADNAARAVTLDDGATINYGPTGSTANKAIPLPWLTGTASPPRVGAEATFHSPVILDWRNSIWKFQPQSQVTDSGSTLVTFEDTRAQNETPVDVGGDISIATFNVLNFFNTTGEAYEDAGPLQDPPLDTFCTFFNDRAGTPIGNDSCGVRLLDDPDTPANEANRNNGSGPRGAATIASLTRQENKLVHTLNTMDASIIGLEELENSIKLPGETNRDEALAYLTFLLNDAAGFTKWKYVKSPGEATNAGAVAEQDVIRQAFIYQPALVTPVGQSDILFGTTQFANAREPLAQAFKAVGAPNSDAFAVVVNHFKSKGDNASPAPPASGDNANDTYVGAFNGDRVRQATRLVEFANDFAEARDIEAVFLAGDFNSYTEEEPIHVLEAGGFEAVESTDNPDEESYSFSGLSGSLDHVLGNEAAIDMVTGADIWEINANESVAYQYSRYNYNATIFFNAGDPFATSDHNPEIVGLDLPDFTPATPKKIQVLGTNDFHGRLLPDGGNAAGAAPYATAVDELRAEVPAGNTIFAAAGDLIGASTFESFVQEDKPTIDALNEMGLEVSSVGNHEFDQGYDDLVDRVIAPYDETTNPLGGAEWEYIAANIDEPEGEDNLAESWTKTVDGVDIGFVGAVTEDLPALVNPAGLQGVSVLDVVDSVNAEAADLKAGGADIIVLLVHEGSPSTDCTSSSFTDEATVFGNIVQNTSADVDAIISGHTHLAYNCRYTVQDWVDETRAVTRRPVVSAGQYGTNLNQLVFNFDTTSGNLLEIEQELVGTAGVGYQADPEVQNIVDDAVVFANDIGSDVLGQMEGPFNRAVYQPASGQTENRGGESTLGNLVAEVQRWATQLPDQDVEADIAFMNPGGLRADMAGSANGELRDLTYRQAANVQPFANTLVNMDLTGAQIETVLEQQWQRTATGSVPSRPFLRLGVSEGFTYTYVETPVTVNAPNQAPVNTFQGEVTGMWLNGVAIDPSATYSVTVNSFLGTGGDNFFELANGANKVDTGKIDLAAMVEYMDQYDEVTPLAVDYSQRAVEVEFPGAAPDAYAPGDTVEFDVASWTMSTAADTKDTDLQVKLGDDVLDTATLNNTIGNKPYDNYGTASVSFVLPADLESGDLELTLVGAQTGTEIPVTIAVERETAEIQILGTNDFHGRLLPDGLASNLDCNSPGVGCPAALLSGAVKELRDENPNTVFAAAGDLIGASTFESFIQNDEPTIDALNEAGLDVSAAGNHEFDQGYEDLVGRVQDSADWEYIAANVEEPEGRDDLAETWTQEFGDVKVGFVGAVTEELPALVSPAGIEGVTVTDIVDATNAAAADLKADGADMVVLLVHEGSPSTSCASPNFTDPGTVWGNITQNTSADVDAIISGHTHLAYDCSFPVQEWVDEDRAVTQRPVVSSGQYGQNLNQLVFTVDAATGEVTAKSQAILALNETNFTEDPAVVTIVHDAKAQADVLGAAVLGQIEAPLNRAKLANGTTENRGGESTLGNLVAEVQRWATDTPTTGEAEIAFMNPGGLRQDMAGTINGGARDVTYRQAAVVQPFANTLVNMDLTGAQIETVLEQQWQRDGGGNVPTRPFLRLGASKGFTYTYVETPVTVGATNTFEGEITGMWLNGVAIDPATTYSVTVNSFLASGGDNFREFANGTGKADTGKVDLQAMVDYLDEFGPVGTPLEVDYSQRAVEVHNVAASYTTGENLTFDVGSWTMSTADDIKDTEILVKLGDTELGTATLDNTIGTAVYDQYGTAHVDVELPVSTPAGDAELTLVGESTGTEVVVPITVEAGEVDVQILGTNDFHGRLLPDGLASNLDCNSPGVGCPAALLSGAVKELRDENPNTVFAAAGDLIGASTFESFIQNDEPTIDALNEAGLDVSAAGNHEFDQGYEDLVGRVQDSADWEYIAANVNEPEGRDDLAETWTQDFDGITVGFVGAVTEELPALVSPAGIEGVTVTDIVDATNAAAADLKTAGADLVVLLVHEGSPSTSCDNVNFTDENTVWGNITQNTSADVDAIISGHTHLAYNCSFPVQQWVDADRAVTDRPVVSSGQYGQNLNQLVFTVDAATGEVAAKSQAILALNETNFTEDPAVVAIVHDAKAQADVLGAAVLGQIEAPLNRAKLANGTTENRGGESTLGNLVAEVQRWATDTPTTGEAEIAFMNPGGLRQDMAGTIDGDARDVTYRQAAVVQPFANTLVNMDLTGAQIETVLEQQWQRDGGGNVPTRPFLRLGASKGFTYTYVETPITVNGTPTFEGEITGMWLNGVAIDPATSYSVTVNSFLASGGDNFREFANGSGKADTGKVDLQAMVDYLAEFGPDGSPLAVDYSQRAVEVENVASSYTIGGDLTFDVGSWTMSTADDVKDTEIQVKIGDEVLGTAALNNTIGTDVFDRYGTAQVGLPIPGTIPAGPATVTLVGANTGTEIVVPVTIEKATPTVTGTDVSVDYGKGTTMEVTVEADGVVPTGTVTLKVGDVQLGTGTLVDGTAIANINRNRVGPGVHEVTISYSGDGSVLPGEGTAQLTVDKATPTVVGTKTTVEYGQATTMAVHVGATGVVPTGEVVLKVGDVRLGSGTLTDGSTAATIGARKLPPGTYEVTILYDGDDFVKSATGTATLVVKKATSTVVAPNTSMTFGQTGSLSVKVKATGVVPTGTVRVFSAGGQALSAATTLVDGQAVVTLTKNKLPASPTPYTVTIKYSGDSFVLPGTDTSTLRVRNP